MEEHKKELQAGLTSTGISGAVSMNIIDLIPCPFSWKAKGET
jgi:hypothetical protein